MEQTVKSCNELTRSWLARCENTNFCLSAPGVWLVLAALQSVAADAVAAELAHASGLDTADAAATAAELLHYLQNQDSLGTAVGLWPSARTHLKADIEKALPGFEVHPLTSSQALDDWAFEKTQGLIETMGITVDDATSLVLATALTAQSDWLQQLEPDVGPWADDSQLWAWGSRKSTDVGDVSVIEDKLSCVRCQTSGGFDVYLVAGDRSDSPRDVMALGLAAVSGEVALKPAADLEIGTEIGCLKVEKSPSPTTETCLLLQLPMFDIAASHDLLQQADLFGLTQACQVGDHFPGLAEEPLFVNAAVQNCRSSYSEKGFSAAAVTAVAFLMSGAPGDLAKQLWVRHDRPFGFLVVDRETNLVLFAGWLEQPSIRPADNHELYR